MTSNIYHSDGGMTYITQDVKTFRVVEQKNNYTNFDLKRATDGLQRERKMYLR